MQFTMGTQFIQSENTAPIPNKVMYGIGHRAAAQFQGLGNLLMAQAIFM